MKEPTIPLPEEELVQMVLDAHTRLTVTALDLIDEPDDDEQETE